MRLTPFILPNIVVWIPSFVILSAMFYIVLKYFGFHIGWILKMSEYGWIWRKLSFVLLWIHEKDNIFKNIFEMFMNIMFYYLVLCVILCLVKFQTCHAADPILSQTTVTDSAGNSADENSVVTFASIPTVSSYKASNSSYSSTGLEWYYSLHTLFIDTLVFPDGFPTGKIIR